MPHIIFNSNFKLDEMPKSIDNLIDFSIDNDAPESAIIIVPTGKFMRKLEKDFIRKYFNKYKKPVSNFKFYTFQTFVNKCYFSLFEFNPGRTISDAYRLTLMEEAYEKADLKYFKSKTNKASIGIIEKLDSIIIGLKEDGISTQSMFEDCQKYNPDDVFNPVIGGVTNRDRLFDIASLYAKYEELLGDELKDSPSLIQRLNKELKQFIQDNCSLQSASGLTMSGTKNKLPIDDFFNPKSIIMFSGFTEFKLPEIEFLSYLAYSSLPSSVILDYTEINGPLFGNMKEAVIKLVGSGFSDATIFEPSIETNIKQLNPENDFTSSKSIYLKRWLFNSEKDYQYSGFGGQIKVLKTLNINDEVRTIAKLVKYLHIKKRIDLADIVICMRNPSDYSDLFREIFSVNSIPLNISDRFELKNSSVITAIFSVFDVVNKGWNFDDLSKMLKSSYLEFCSENGENINYSNFLKICRENRLFGGLKRGGRIKWIADLDYLYSKYKNRIDYVSKYSDDEMEIYLAQKEFENIELFKNDFQHLLNKINWLDEKYTPSQINSLIKEKIIVGLNIKENVVGFFDKVINQKEEFSHIENLQLIEEAEKDARALQKFIEVLDELTAITAERSNNAPLKFSEFIEKLKVAISGEKYQIREKPGYGVTITSIEQTRGLNFAVAILCGANDGKFPLPFRTDSFLGKQLPNSEDRHLESEKVLFYQFLTNNKEMLDNSKQMIFISYPSVYKNEELVASPFINSLFKITDIDDNKDNKISMHFDLVQLKIASQNDKLDEHQKKQLKEIEWFDAITQKSEYIMEKAEYLLNKFKEESFKVSHLDFISLYEVNLLHEIIKDKLNKNKKHDTVLDGLSEKEQEILEKFKNKSYSVTEIEEYASCGLKYYYNRVLRINQEKELELFFSPMEIGNILHSILNYFYKRVAKLENIEDKSPIKLDVNNKDKYYMLLLETADEVLDKYDFDHPIFNIEKENIKGDSNNSGLLYYWLDRELDRISKGWTFAPAFFEYNFSEGTQKYICLDNGLKLKGKIDRIEISDDGTEFMIADYKNKINENKHSDKAIEKGESFQIPIYLLAAEKSLVNEFDKNLFPAGGVYYSIKPAKKSFKLVAVYDELKSVLDEKAVNNISKNEQRENLEKIAANAKSITDNIAQGVYIEKPDKNKACNYCDYKNICKYYKELM